MIWSVFAISALSLLNNQKTVRADRLANRRWFLLQKAPGKQNGGKIQPLVMLAKAGIRPHRTFPTLMVLKRP